MNRELLIADIVAAKNDIAQALSYCHRGNHAEALSSLKRCHRTTGKIITLLGETITPSVAPPDAREAAGKTPPPYFPDDDEPPEYGGKGN